MLQQVRRVRVFLPASPKFVHLTVVVTVPLRRSKKPPTVPSEGPDGIRQQIKSEADLLTDRELGALAPKEKIFKVADRDGMYVAVLPTGTRAFRYDYRLNGRRETLAIGRYDPACKVIRDPEALEYGMGLSLREARTLLDRARREVEQGMSPSRAKVEKRTAASEALTSGGWAEKYFAFKGDPKSGAEQLADSTLELRRSTFRRTLEIEIGRLRLEEITVPRARAVLEGIKDKRGPAVALHAREVVLAVFVHAQASGMQVINPCDVVRAFLCRAINMASLPGWNARTLSTPAELLWP